ncbi:Bug family tripartite tricarboxylate transporter substrate binding protein [Planomonospora venezuelensis]|uniref:Putative tricarboxylic transport membrane protein n=1 Tax=Planomonospora venezuelensis TaxID=1999 RepID=A0A841DBV9_PLAVE|nr:tripartite tricarboxylate transporter substrate-binding protein [Planomonospora venezuelensis]MBB5967611.1 putative tricarboxylic transport membrane protein [Planomonospora venezuelensis]GIN00263.1 hypothetical protein Pve01_19210 [Planomonospora venezuelensis]
MRRRRFLTLTAGVAAAAAGCGLTGAGGGAGVPMTGRLSVAVPPVRGQRWARLARALAEVAAGDGLAAQAGVASGGGPDAGGGTGGAPVAAAGAPPVAVAGAGGRPGAAPGAPGVSFAMEGRLLLTGMAVVTAAELSGGPSVAGQATPLARLVGDWAALVVSTGSPLRSFEDFAAALRRDPAGLVVGGRTAGGPDHVLYGLIGKCLGVDTRLLDYAGYPGLADASEALHGGRTTALLGPARSFAAEVAAGRLRPLAVSAADRIDGIDAPTLMELEIRLEYSDWYGVLGPRGMDDGDRAAAVALCDRLDASPRWRDRCAREGWDRVHLSGDDFRTWLATETRRTREALHEFGLLSASTTG